MPTTRRTRRLSTPPARVWEVVGDPHHMARWWPEVRRVEGVFEDRFTQVFMTKKGRMVRVDQFVLEAEPPDPAGEPAGRMRWAQEIEGTPFERVLEESLTEVVLEP
ncbi:MAG TPA: SRPBCC family protein, partial [Solirubrobacteraceae bacterium]|nr:SRPBCC family protein [Solirubrobacteraceae bacterium]